MHRAARVDRVSDVTTHPCTESPFPSPSGSSGSAADPNGAALRGSDPNGAALLGRLGLPVRDLGELPASPQRFPDGVAWRMEIPSVEGPGCVDAVLADAHERAVPIRRMSQGSGVFLHTDDELDQMAAAAAAAGVELSLFARPSAGWGLSASARSAVGPLLAPTAHGQGQLAAVLDDVLRAVEHGIRSVLVSDLGALAAAGQLKQSGDLPADLTLKVSVMLPAANAAAARVLEDLGAGTLNLPTDLSLGQIAAIRAAVDVPLDVYVEAPDNTGGFIRHHEIPDLVRVAAPVYLKFGLRNAPDVYPSGTHLEATTVALSRERVRRARLGYEFMQRAGVDLHTSAPNAVGLAVPQLS